MTSSVDIPYSIAAALPSLAVLDITNDVAQEVAGGDVRGGLAYVSAPPGCIVRVNERETGFFCDLEQLLSRLAPVGDFGRERMLSLLLGPRTEQVPFADGRLSIGQWQRILLVDLTGGCRGEWTLTLVG
jgi:thiamine phosphate synthase YjbQ (UPF0047 family)